MDTISVPPRFYFFAAWQVIPYFGLILASVWLFRRVQRTTAWFMLVGSALKSCDAFVKQFILNQTMGLWPMKGSVQSPADMDTLRLQQDVWTWMDRIGLWGLTLFVVGLILFARQMRSKALQATAATPSVSTEKHET
jgi:ABC-type dipeptide/oligopeptide/nickel transport system permease component